MDDALPCTPADGRRPPEATPEPAPRSIDAAQQELTLAQAEAETLRARVSGLFDDHVRLRWQHERVMSALPVPVLGTDLDGVLTSVNAAATVLLGARVHDLVRTSALALFGPADQPQLRRALTGLGGDGAGFDLEAVLAVDQGPVELSVTRTVGHDDRLTWLLQSPSCERTTPHPVLLAALATLADLPTRAGTLQRLLAEAARVCARVLGAGTEVSITAGPPTQPAAFASTSQHAQRLDGAQLLVGSGPSVQAGVDLVTVCTPSVSSDDRWPELRPHVPAGTGGVVAVPLQVGGALKGVLTFYLPGEGAELQQVEPAELLGATVSSILHEVDVRTELQTMGSQMQEALASRAVIDQAKGVLMGDRGWDADRAFAHLVSLSSANGLKVRDVAAALVDRSAGAEDRP